MAGIPTRPRSTRVATRLTATIGAGLLLLAACGDDEDTATIDPTTTTEPTTTVVGDPPAAGVVQADSPDGDPDPPAPVGEPSTADFASPAYPSDAVVVAPDGEPAVFADVSVSQYDSVDRIVFEFEADGTVPEFRVERTTAPIYERPDGRELDLQGEAFATISFAPAVDVEAVRADIERIRAPEDGGITEIAQTAGDDATVEWAIGMVTPAPIGVAVLSGDGVGTRVIVDVVRAGADGRMTVASVDDGVRDFRVVTYPSESGRCFELLLPTDAEPSRSSVECDPVEEPLEIRVLREGDVEALIGVIAAGSEVDDVALVADDGNIVAGEEDPTIVDLGDGERAFVPVQDPAFIQAIVGYDSAGDEIVRIDL